MSFFQNLFKNVIHDRDPKHDTVTVKDKPKPKYYGTVVPYPNFSASSDASVLKSSIEKGVDKDVIISILVKRSNEQRQKIKAVYEASTGNKLDKALKSTLRSDLEDLSLALLMAPTQFDAYQLRKATKGLGTNEKVLVEILATRSNQEIQEIKRVFKEEYKAELEDIIKDDTSGDFTTALLAMLKATKDETADVNVALAQKDAKTLVEAGENAKKVNVHAFIDILTSRNGPQLSKTFQEYASISHGTLPKTLEAELRGDIENCLIDIVKCAWNMPALFAEKLHLAMKGPIICDKTLIRVLVSRSEVDMKKIIAEYKAMFGIGLQEDLTKHTKGHFRDALIGLCGAH